MNSEINRDTIKAFILNELSPEKMSLVEDAIDADMSLKRMYADVRFEIDAMIFNAKLMNPIEENKFRERLINKMRFCREVSHREEKNVSPEVLRLRRIVCETDQEPKSNAPKTLALGTTIKGWLVAASVIVLFIIGGGIAFYSQTTDSPENSLYEKFYSPLNSKDISLLANNPLGIARQKYAVGEYINSIMLLKDLPSTVTIEAEKNLLIGLNMMEIGKYTEAANYLELAFSKQSDFDYIPQVQWYLGLCYLKTGDKEKAIHIFNAIIKCKGYNYKEAKKILKKITN